MTAISAQTAGSARARSLSDEDVSRARFYGLVAFLLVRPPDAAMLAELADMGGDDSELGQAFSALSDAARTTNPVAAAEEFHDLFIGVGRGELLPYGSYYLTGFLNEKPLARLRARMAELGIERDPSVKEPEDHMAAVMDMMGGLIAGTFGAPASLSVQKDFFEAHLGDWGPYFFRDLEKAQASRFYAPVGRLGRAFLAIEQAAFDMVD